MHETASPPTVPLPPDAPRPQPIKITYGPDWVLSDRRLELYQKCPRRFFYTHVLGLGGARKATAFSRTHDCLYELIRWMSQARFDGEPAESPMRKRRSNRSGRSAVPRITPLRATTGVSPRAWSARWCVPARAAASSKSEPLAIDFPNGRVVVEPNELAEMLDGKVVLRRVRTGYRTQGRI